MTYVNAGSVTACGILFPVLGAIAVVLRFRIRRTRKLDLGADDWLCLPALILLWAEGGLQIAGAATHSFGWHSPSYDSAAEFLNDDEPSVRILGKLQTAFDLIHPIALGLLKLSICLFYRRIFRGRKFNIISWITIGVITLWSMAFFITIAAACGKHIEANWDSLAVLKHECVDTFRMLLTYTITDVAVDLVIIVVPIPLIFGLQMPLKRKFAVCGAILVGALAIACGITRMVIFIEVLVPPLLANARVAGLLATDDIGVVSLLLFWGMVELGVGIIAICLPTFRPLFHGWSPESIMCSVRSALSTRSVHSGGSSGAGKSTGRSPSKEALRLASASSIFGIHKEATTNHQVGIEGTVSRAYGGEEGGNDIEKQQGGRDIRVDREFCLDRLGV